MVAVLICLAIVVHNENRPTCGRARQMVGQTDNGIVKSAIKTIENFF